MQATAYPIAALAAARSAALDNWATRCKRHPRAPGCYNPHATRWRVEAQPHVGKWRIAAQRPPPRRRIDAAFLASLASGTVPLASWVPLQTRLAARRSLQRHAWQPRDASARRNNDAAHALLRAAMLVARKATPGACYSLQEDPELTVWGKCVYAAGRQRSRGGEDGVATTSFSMPWR